MVSLKMVASVLFVAFMGFILMMLCSQPSRKDREIMATKESISIARAWVLQENFGTLMQLFNEDTGTTVGENAYLLALFELRRGEEDYVLAYKDCLRLIANHQRGVFGGSQDKGALREKNPAFRFVVGVLRNYYDMLDVEAEFLKSKDCETARSEMKRIKEDLARIRAREIGRAGRMG